MYDGFEIFENKEGVPIRAVLKNTVTILFQTTDVDNEYYAEYNKKLGIFKNPDGKYTCQFLKDGTHYVPKKTIKITREK